MATTEQQKANVQGITPDKNKKLVEESMQLAQQMRSDRTTWDSHWQALANYVQPRKAWITTKTDFPQALKETFLYDSTAVQANMVLAAGHMTWMTPAENLWFSYDCPEALKTDDDAKGWFHRVTMITAQMLSRSNFYSEIHESYLDRGGFGTCAMFINAGKRVPLHFSHEDIGTYSIAEDDEGYPDTLVRDFKLTYHQAILKFGEDGVAPSVAKEWRENANKVRNKELDFIHVTLPRMERTASKPDKLNMPFESVYIDVKHQHACDRGGFQEMPYAVSRFLKWGRTPYGWSPSWVALPEARQLNFLEKNLDLAVELMMFPRILVPSEMKNKVDFRPGGITYLKSGIAKDDQPREWATTAEPKAGMERSEQKRQVILKAFHNDLFQMFSQIDRQMTATEVAERSSEKLIQFSPTFARLSVEFYTPILRRVFRLLYNMGHFPPAPQSMFQYLGGAVLIAEPQIVYNSRVAFAMKQVENVGFLRTMSSLQPLFAVKPDILDHYNWNAIVRDMGRNDTIPEEWMLPGAQVAQIQQQRADQQAKLEHAQIAEQAAGAVSKLGAVKPDSPVGKMIASRAGQLPGTPVAA